MSTTELSSGGTLQQIEKVSPTDSSTEHEQRLRGKKIQIFRL